MTEKRLYDGNMYCFDRPERSVWEDSAGDVDLNAAPLDGDERCEVAIIGSGYTGLSAAYHLARRFDIDCRVLDAGPLGWGASGRNGGFCSIGGTAADDEDLVARYGLDDVREYYRAQVAAVGLVRRLIEREAIDTPMQGDGELEVAHSRAAFDDLKDHAEQSFTHLGVDKSMLTADEFRERYFDSTEQFGASVTRPTFGIHPLRFVRGLAAAAERHGAILHPLSEVLHWSRDGAHHLLRLANGTIRSRYVIFATNGYMPEQLHATFAARPLPLISAIVATRPLTDDELAAHHWQTESPAINSRRLMNYFRLLPDRRFLFGGRGHSSGSVAGSDANYGRLVERLRHYWPEWGDVSVEYRWHGFVCFTRRLTPAIGRLDDDPSVLFGFGYHGNGVNTAVWTGRKLARWIGKGKPPKLPQMVRGLPPRFPLAALRRRYLGARLGWLGLLDRIGA